MLPQFASLFDLQSYTWKLNPRFGRDVLMTKSKKLRATRITAYTGFAFFLIAALIIVAMGATILGWKSKAEFTLANGLSAILALTIGYVSVIRPWLTRPRLMLVAEASPPYSPMPEEATGGSWTLRIRIINEGIDTAKNCVGRLLEVQDSNGKRLEKFDPMKLYWQR